ncbi:MAG TPA: ABC transporter ATP-binding protein [Candidatus Baltobacteraceae bacterium]|nr:ABC transporter ATP-binding protein [Candidatus Baltobacteraceae bacterium]
MSTFLSVSNLWKVFPGRVQAVRGVSLSLSRGELFAFLGPNGAGKSTTIRMICGLCRPSSGTIEIEGNDSVRGRLAYTRSIGLVSQHFNIHDDLTAYENMLIHAKLYGMLAFREEEGKQ